MSIQLHELKGCAPAPLANYLKALGILRLIVEQGADPGARGWWQDERFRLLTKLTREELKQFFLHYYEPTPLLSPWNKGCGFFKLGDPGLAPLETSSAERFGRFRNGIVESRRLLDEQNAADQIIRAIKARTKTNKTFQTDDQRLILKTSDTFRTCVAELQKQVARPDISSARRHELTAALAAVEAMVETAGLATKTEARLLKESDGYKRLLAIANRRYEGLRRR